MEVRFGKGGRDEQGWAEMKGKLDGKMPTIVLQLY
jgi:hypothetical protein